MPFKGKILEIFHTSNYIVKEETENEEVVFLLLLLFLIYLGYDYVNEALFSQEKSNFKIMIKIPKNI